MFSVSNQFLRMNYLNKPVNQAKFKISRNKSDNSFNLFDTDDKLVLSSKVDGKIIKIFDFESNKVAEIHKVGFFTTSYIIYYKSNINSEMVGYHYKLKKDNFFYIPELNAYGSGFNTIKNLDILKNSNDGKIITRSLFFNESSHFQEIIESKKNTKYYMSESLAFELVKKSVNNYSVYIDIPYSIVQGFSLAIINIM